MQSQAAQDLASSIQDGAATTANWNRMTPTTTTNNNNNKTSSLQDEMNASLLGQEEGKTKKPGALDTKDIDNIEPPHSWLVDIFHRLYGPLELDELRRTLCLASTLFFMIGGYWLLRSLKDTILIATAGSAAIPRAKMLSVIVVLGVVTIYNRMLDAQQPKHVLFYRFGTTYFGLFTVIGLLLMHPTIGLPNTTQDIYRPIGWISYCAIESFGSVMVSLFWSFTNSNFDLKTAKASYGIIVAAAQMGSVLGPTVVTVLTQRVGVAVCYLLGACCMLGLQATMHLYVSLYGVQTESNHSAAASKPRTGVWEGLRLFYQHHYVKGIFAISCLFMVEVTIVDYTMKLLATEYFVAEYPNAVGEGQSIEATNALATFMGVFGQATNTLSFLLSLLGTSAVIRHLGLRLTLLLFPSLCLAVILMVRLYPTLYVVFAAMMLLKACSYALNNPTKELLYQPTSASVRYKAKSWIDIFGARGSKALGSVVTNAFSDSASTLVANGSLVGMAVATFLIWNARYMGHKFDEYTNSGYIVGEEDDEMNDGHVALNQQDAQDTSCAIEESGEDDATGREEEGQAEEVVGNANKAKEVFV